MSAATENLTIYIRRGRCKCYKLQDYKTCFLCKYGDYSKKWLEETVDCYSRMNDFSWNTIKEKMKESYEIRNGILFYEK